MICFSHIFSEPRKSIFELVGTVLKNEKNNNNLLQLFLGRTPEEEKKGVIGLCFISHVGFMS